MDPSIETEDASLRRLSSTLEGASELSAKFEAATLANQGQEVAAAVQAAADAGGSYQEFLADWEPWTREYLGYSSLRWRLSESLLELDLLAESLSQKSWSADGETVAQTTPASVVGKVRRNLGLWTSSLPILQAFRESPRPPVPIGLEFLFELRRKGTAKGQAARRARLTAESGVLLLLATLGAFTVASNPSPIGLSLSSVTTAWVFGAFFPAALFCSYGLTVMGLIGLVDAANASRVSDLSQASVRLRKQDARLRRQSDAI